MKKDPQPDLVVLPRPEFEDLLEQAACRGARKALHEVGLNDEGAATDVRDLRDLLSAVRTAKTEALRAIVRWFTVGVLLLIMAGIAAKSGYYFTTK
ncbi:MAG: hypothetical protein H6922_03030 [Pseudomonadaceae bacterium]|jgi:hypothetical protein|nr:hypothetical protein [Pseudomonadaceae bacterium]